GRVPYEAFLVRDDLRAVELARVVILHITDVHASGAHVVALFLEPLRDLRRHLAHLALARARVLDHPDDLAVNRALTRSGFRSPRLAYRLLHHALDLGADRLQLVLPADDVRLGSLVEGLAGARLAGRGIDHVGDLLDRRRLPRPAERHDVVVCEIGERFGEAADTCFARLLPEHMLGP